jgi:glycosyltransferase involved in cell wall biosynthesis
MSKPPHFPGRLAVQQRVLTPYRAAFFDLLAQNCDRGLTVCAGLPRPEESIAVTDNLVFAHCHPVKNIHLLRGPLYFCHQRRLLDWLAAEDPQALIMEANPRYISAYAAMHWMKQRGRPIIGWGLGATPVSGILSTFRSTRRLAFLHHFNGMLTYSGLGADQYSNLGIPADRIFVVPNAAAPKPSHGMPRRPARIPGKPSILFVGRLQMRKRVDLLIEACARLPQALQPELVIVGDGPERSTLENLAKKVYPLAVFPGSRHGTDLVPYFSSADLFVLPGTGGLAVQEAMAYGLPIVLGRGDGTNADLVRPENGWQILPDSLDALVETLQVALSDVSRLRRMGAESYRIVSEEINLERMVEKFIGALNKLIPPNIHR